MQIIKLKKTKSTLDRVKRLLKKSARTREDVIVVTRSVARGKGLFLKADKSSLGGVYLSYLHFYTATKKRSLADLMQAAAQAVINTLIAFGVKVEADSEGVILASGKKIGEIFIEPAFLGDYLDYTVVTINLNVNNDILSDGERCLTSVKQITGDEVNVQNVVFTLYYNLQQA